MVDLSIYLPKEKLTTHYFTRGDDSVAIPQENIEAWRSQWEHYRPITWKEWAGIPRNLISRDEIPVYFDYEVPPPDYELSSVMVDSLNFSVPFCGDEIFNGS